MTPLFTNEVNRAFQAMAQAIQYTTNALETLGRLVEANRERWLCEGMGQWPDRFSLLNRYVRTDKEPPFIFND